MSDAAEKVINTAIEKNIDMRTAAFVNAINKLHEYYSLVGIKNWFWKANLFYSPLFYLFLLIFNEDLLIVFTMIVMK